MFFSFGGTADEYFQHTLTFYYPIGGVLVDVGDGSAD
jgi:hypothetical protein